MLQGVDLTKKKKPYNLKRLIYLTYLCENQTQNDFKMSKNCFLFKTFFLKPCTFHRCGGIHSIQGIQGILELHLGYQQKHLLV